MEHNLSSVEEPILGNDGGSTVSDEQERYEIHGKDEREEL